jgi:lipoprotein-releasing system ATP-binding protein
VRKAFSQGGRRLEVLRDANLVLRRGEIVALVGPSGAGKSTLLHIAGLLEAPDAGEIEIMNQPASRMSDDACTTLRGKAIGFVYQYHHLLPEFSAEENVVVPQMIVGRSRRQARQRASELLEAVGLAERKTHRPAQLSGGEQQRVVIARALANAPAVLLADEPTGNLDPTTADSVFELLLGVVRGAGLAGLVATHNLALAQRMDRILILEEGHLAERAVEALLT